MIDWIIIGAILLCAINGWRNGLIRQLVSVVALFVAFFFSKNWYWVLTPLVAKVVPEPTWAPDNPLSGISLTQRLQEGVAFLIMFLLVFFVVKLIGLLLDWVANLPGLSVLNRVSGLVLGAVFAILTAAVLVQVLNMLPYEQLQQGIAASKLAQTLLTRFDFFGPVLQTL
ncbi:MAG TPA: CvpA family protein [Bacilli bacterium]|nr:CvpA family protein [Bacilli bacterium]